MRCYRVCVWVVSFGRLLQTYLPFLILLAIILGFYFGMR